MTSNPMPSQAAVRDLLQVFDWLANSLLPSNERPYTAPQMTAQRRSEMARQDRIERHMAGIGQPSGKEMLVPLGESPAPMNLAVADLCSEIADAADKMCTTVSFAAKVEFGFIVTRRGTAVRFRPGTAEAFTDPRPFLHRVDRLLPRATAVAATVEQTCDTLIYRGHTVLGILGDGQILPTLCPWCDGKTAAHPVGGARTLRVRAFIPEDKKQAFMRPADHQKTIKPGEEHQPVELDWYVVCEGGLCEPSEADCGTWIRGRPAWNLKTEGEWLAQRIELTAS